MRITKNQLKQIIKEELSGVLRELAPEQEPPASTAFSDEELSRQVGELSDEEYSELIKQYPTNRALNQDPRSPENTMAAAFGGTGYETDQQRQSREWADIEQMMGEK
jgi:hypothetical protein